ncbi:MAG: class I SAM-dependent methyltransferase [Promethearchaeota archaeon]
MNSDKQAFDELQDQLRQQLLVYLRRAYQQIPPLTTPRILDVGCGSGIPTIELARLSGGDVTGIDIDTEALQRLEFRAKNSGLSDRVHAINKSLIHMDFPDASFDIIWAEGSIAVIGFHKGIRDWKRFLTPQGYLVAHDHAGNIARKQQQVKDSGYTLIDCFELSNDVWWHEYCKPLHEAIQQFRSQGVTNPELEKAWAKAQGEINGYHIHPERYHSAYFIMQNTTK